MRVVAAALLFAVTCSPALAQREPEIVIPGKAGVPVIINGIDASWSVVDGEFGLDRVKTLFQDAPSSSAHDLCATILQSVNDFGGQEPIGDDRTALALIRSR